MTFDGTWRVAIATPLGKMVAELAIATEGGAVRGTATQGGESVPFLDPIREGARLTWSQRVTRPMSLLLHFDVTVEGDRMGGTVRAGRLPPSALTGERLGAPPPGDAAEGRGGGTRP